MIESTGRRWKLGIIAGAGLACLGAGPLFISGCSTATVSESRTTGKSNQQVAKAKKPASGKTASKQVVAKGAPGKVKISDLNDQQRDYMAGQVAQNKAAQNKALASARSAASAADPSASGTVASNIAKRAPAVQQRQTAPRTSTSTPQTVAQRRPAASSQVQPRANVVASNTRASTGSITQTSGDRSAMVSVAVRPPMITPRKTEWKEEGARETAASNHERRRADRLMQRASAMYASGYREEALRLASVAAELEYSQLAVYKRGEERPSDFVEFLLLTSKANRPYSTIEVPPRARLQQADPSPSTQSSVVPATAESTRSWTNGGNERNATGDVLRTEASGLPQAARDLNPASSVTPRFATADTINSRTAANAGQLEVPVAQAPRKADVSVVTADGNGVNPDEAATGEESQSVVTADQVEESDERASSPGVVAARGPAQAAAPAPEAEIEPPVEADAPAVSPHNRSQLTIASLIGLVVGVGGMFGLGWWRRQERQHYASGK
jgi:hypothetical protein